MVMVLFIQSRFDITINTPVVVIVVVPTAAAAAAADPTPVTRVNSSTILVQMLMLLTAYRYIRIVTLHFVHIIGDEWVGADTVATIANANISEIIILIECLQYLLGYVRTTGDVWWMCHR